MIRYLRRKVLTLMFNYKYRSVGYDEVCCCGEEMDKQSYTDNHSPRCAKEYTLYCYLKEKGL